MQQTWFITGSSRGLGRALVKAALDAGDLVAATARQPAQLDDLVAEHGARIHAIALDVTDPQAARSTIAQAHRHFGRLDVIVNNAGYANVSPIETSDDEDFRRQFETNFWGAYNVSKAAFPALREQGGGIVAQISSMGGRVGGVARARPGSELHWHSVLAQHTRRPAPQPDTVEGGKVVLVDFWTYSRINCQRSLPHVEAWYKDYKNEGLVVVGVHTPEFAFEHVVSNVRSAVRSLGIDYPVAVDSNYATWDAYSNEYWPADYLIDPRGQVRAYDYGEGGYSAMETDIRELLTANGVIHLPARTDVPDKTPAQPITQESYLGYGEEQYAADETLAPDKAVDCHAPSSVPKDSFAFNGIWTDHNEDATAGARAEITLNFTANDAYLVMGGSGTVEVSLDGHHLSRIDVSGVPRLYTLSSGESLVTGELEIDFAPGVQAYDFTFG